MKCAISRALLERLLRDADAAGKREICGLLIREEGLVVEAVSVRNVAADPERGFEFDPLVHIAASRTARLAGSRIIGHYHSHPGGNPVPSSIDAGRAEEQDTYWLILGGGAARLWLSRSGGTVLGAFEPVELDIL